MIFNGFLAGKRRGGGGILWTPTELSSSFWIDFADADSLTLNGSTIAQADDLTGNNNNFVAESSSHEPAYLASGINSLPVANFDGTTDKFTLTGLLSGNTYSLVVVETGGVATNRQTIFGRASGQGLIPFADSNNTNPEVFRGTSVPTVHKNGFLETWANRDEAFTSITDTNPHVLIFNGCTLSVEFKYFAWTTSAIYKKGNVGEIIAVNGTLSVDDRLRLEGYLAHKWGLTANLPSDHPYKTNPPTL